MASCQDCEKHLFPFLDGALDIRQTLDIQLHLDTCTRCAQRIEAERAVNAFVRQHATTPSLPEYRKRQIIRNAMRFSPVSKGRKRWNLLPYLRDAAIGTAVATVALFLGLHFVSPPSQVQDMAQKLSREVSMTYRTYISSSPPYDMTGSDHAAFVAWVKNRMGTDVEVPWITEKETRLLGGRLCRILDHKSTILMYRRQGAKVFLFAFKGDPLPRSSKHVVSAAGHTFHVFDVSNRPVAIWQHDRTIYSLVGDLSQDALVQLATTIDYR